MSEKSEMIQKYISLKEQYQTLYFNHQEALEKIESLKNENAILKSKVENNDCENKSVVRDNVRLQAIVKQTRYSAVNTVTPVKSPRKTHKNTPKMVPSRKSLEFSDEEYEVEELLEHRGRKPNREFLVRWKNFSHKNDSWEKQKHLSCPKVLKEYLKKHRLT